MHQRQRMRTGLLTAAAVAALAAVLWLPPLLAARGGPAGAVRGYLLAMSRGSCLRALRLLDDLGPGMDPRPGGGAASDPTRGALECLEAQRAMILMEFGPQAWDRASFRLEKLPSLDQRLEWRASDGRAVSAAQARRLLEAFWARVGTDHGVDPSLVLEPPLAGLTPGQAAALNARRQQAARCMEEHRAELPARLEPAETYASYLAHLDFGSPGGASGCHHFTLTVTNRTGAWKVSDLQWCDRDQSPPGDI
ncbi:MAG: hypothetical protein K6T75_01215 [Acetobacteraceae bacterium]|nr:hypothetical protein [Acetobacteraceae bacterium]